MYRNNLIKLFFSLTIIFVVNIKSLAAEACLDDQNSWCVYKACASNPQNIPEGTYYYWTVGDNVTNRLPEPVFKTTSGPFTDQAACSQHLRHYFCNFRLRRERSCIIASTDGTAIRNWPYGMRAEEINNYCNGETVTVDANNMTSGADFNGMTNWRNYFGGLYGVDYDEMTPAQKASIYGDYKCQGGVVIPPRTINPVQCGIPPIITSSDVTCTGADVCRTNNTYVSQQTGTQNFNYFCVNNQIVKCPANITNYDQVSPTACNNTAVPPPNPNVGCDESMRNQTVTIAGKAYACICSVYNNPYYNWLYCSFVGSTIDINGVCLEKCVLRNPREVVQQRVDPMTPLRLFKVLANFMFYLAVFVFIINIMVSGYGYIRSGGEPTKLEAVKDRITNSIYGLVFILVVGGVLNYLVGILSSAIR